MAGLVAASLAAGMGLAPARTPPGVERLTHHWNGHAVAALRAGDPAGPRVIFIHGTPGAAAGWRTYLAAVPPGVEYVAADRPGFGASGPPGAVTGLEAQARALLPLMEGGPAILVGHSLGAPVAAAAALLAPERTAGLVLVAGALDPALEEIHPMQPVGEWRGVRALLPRAIRNANRELLALEGELAALAPRLAEIAGPVEIVHGTADNLVPFANVAFMERRLSGADLTVTALEGANHFIPWTARDAVETAILRIARL